MCLPQMPRTSEEQEVFKKELAGLNGLSRSLRFLQLRKKGDDYSDRSWSCRGGS